MDAAPLLTPFGLCTAQGDLAVHSPIDGSLLGHQHRTTVAELGARLALAESAFRAWRRVPAPRRGELVRLFGEELRARKEELARLVTAECGKILEEARGEVQEVIDICDFAVGLSRQLHGLTIASERPGHRMMESWHPLGVVGVVTAFNFPVAVWGWNAALALVCGDSVLWKPSERTPLSALAMQSVLNSAAKRFGEVPDGLAQVAVGGSELAVALADARSVALLSATGSTAMGRALAPRVAARLGRSLLELGGNNAAILCPSADLDLAVRAILFAWTGTAGQRCTSLRRLIVHRSRQQEVVERLLAAASRLPIGDPRDAATLVGPLIDVAAARRMDEVLARAGAEGGRVHGGSKVTVPDCAGGVYVRPALVEMPAQTALMHEETFAPVLWVVGYDTWDEAVALNNAVPQGLASAVFTTDLREAEAFLGPEGSDCGIANVNLGPSGAEIGGAFGGDKDTGGGRESGSDCWKAYMRRATNTINGSRQLPLAQGIRYDPFDACPPPSSAPH